MTLTLPSKNIIALDLGMVTGFAGINREGEFKSWSKSVSKKKKDGGGIDYALFYDLLLDVCVGYIGRRCVVDIFYEWVEPAIQRSKASAYAYGAFKGVLEVFCYRHQIPLHRVPVHTIKKFTTGKGNAKKEDMIDMMRAKGHDVTDHNQADALALLYYAIYYQKQA